MNKDGFLGNSVIHLLICKCKRCDYEVLINEELPLCPSCSGEDILYMGTYKAFLLECKYF